MQSQKPSPQCFPSLHPRSPTQSAANLWGLWPRWAPRVVLTGGRYCGILGRSLLVPPSPRLRTKTATRSYPDLPGGAAWQNAVQWQKVMIANMQTELDNAQAANDIVASALAAGERTQDLERLVVGLKARLAKLERTLSHAIRMVDVWHTRAVDADRQLRQLRGIGEVGE